MFLDFVYKYELHMGHSPGWISQSAPLLCQQLFLLFLLSTVGRAASYGFPRPDPRGMCCFGSCSCHRQCWCCWECGCCWLCHSFYSRPLLLCLLVPPHIQGKRPRCIHFEDPVLGTSSRILTGTQGWADPGCRALPLQGTGQAFQMDLLVLN